MKEVKMKPKHVFVSLDGVDDIGKTTVARFLATVVLPIS